MAKLTSAVQKVLRRHAGIRLDIGCGKIKQDGFVGMDVRRLPGVDVVHDWEKMPWPFPDNCANTVLLSHVLEHVKPWLFFPFMAEIHRVCKPHAQIFVSGPYAIGFRYVQDPTHITPINEATFCYFDPTHQLYAIYKPPPFKIGSFERIPAGNDADYNCILICQKGSAKGGRHA